MEVQRNVIAALAFAGAAVCAHGFYDATVQEFTDTLAVAAAPSHKVTITYVMTPAERKLHDDIDSEWGYGSLGLGSVAVGLRAKRIPIRPILRSMLRVEADNISNDL